MPGWPNLAEFPRTQWLSAARRALTAAPHDAFGYGDALGRVELRTVLADYLARARGVYAEPERVVICSGFHDGLMLMGQALRARRVRAVAVESYGFDLYRDLLTSAACAPRPSTSTNWRASDDLARLRGVGAVLLTPAHQFPRASSCAGPARGGRRLGACHRRADLGGRLRRGVQIRPPAGGLFQGLDPERVVYFGSASKSLAPGLRLAWMVLPEELVPETWRPRAPSNGPARWTS